MSRRDSLPAQRITTRGLLASCSKAVRANLLMPWRIVHQHIRTKPGAVGKGCFFAHCLHGLQKWVWWAPLAAAFMTTLIIMDELLPRLAFDNLFGSASFYQILLVTTIIGYAGYGVGRLIARVR